MRSWWKILLSVALVLPVGAYVVGSLVASAADDQRPRPVLRIDPPERSTTGPATPVRPRRAGPTDRVEVITPEYDDLDRHDNAGDDDHGRHGGDSGSGGGTGTSGGTSGGHDDGTSGGGSGSGSSGGSSDHGGDGGPSSGSGHGGRHG